MKTKAIDRLVLYAIAKQPSTGQEIYLNSCLAKNTVAASIHRLIRRKLITLGENKKYERVNP